MIVFFKTTKGHKGISQSNTKALRFFVCLRETPSCAFVVKKI